MELCQRWEQILCELRPVFRREKTFEWFVVLMWGVLLNTAPPAVTSYVNAVGLGERFYAPALHWFHSTAFRVDAQRYPSRERRVKFTLSCEAGEAALFLNGCPVRSPSKR